MRIRKEYYPCYDYSEAIFVRDVIQNWISIPKYKKILRKYKQNFIIAIRRKLIPRDYHQICGCHRKLFKRTFPISLTINDLISSLKGIYKEECGGNVTFSKELEKSLSSKEKEIVNQDSKKERREKYQYLLDIVENLVNIDKSK